MAIILFGLWRIGALANQSLGLAPETWIAIMEALFTGTFLVTFLVSVMWLVALVGVLFAEVFAIRSCLAFHVANGAFPAFIGARLFPGISGEATAPADPFYILAAGWPAGSSTGWWRAGARGSGSRCGPARQPSRPPLRPEARPGHPRPESPKPWEAPLPKLDDFMPRILVVALGLAAGSCGLRLRFLPVHDPSGPRPPGRRRAKRLDGERGHHCGDPAAHQPRHQRHSAYRTTYLVWQMGVAGVVVAEVRGESSFFSTWAAGLPPGWRARVSSPCWTSAISRRSFPSTSSRPPQRAASLTGS